MKQSDIFRVTLGIMCLFLAVFIFLIAVSDGFTELIEDVVDKIPLLPAIAGFLFIGINFWGLITWLREGRPSSYNEWIYSNKQGKIAIIGVGLFVLAIIYLVITYLK